MDMLFEVTNKVKEKKWWYNYIGWLWGESRWEKVKAWSSRKSTENVWHKQIKTVVITQRYEVTKEEQNPEIFKSELVIGLEVGVVGQGIFTFYYRIISTFLVYLMNMFLW